MFQQGSLCKYIFTKPYLKQHNIVERLLDFCKNPLNNEVTIFALNLLIKFMDHDSEIEFKKVDLD